MKYYIITGIVFFILSAAAFGIFSRYTQSENQIALHLQELPQGEVEFLEKISAELLLLLSYSHIGVEQSNIHERVFFVLYESVEELEYFTSELRELRFAHALYWVEDEVNYTYENGIALAHPYVECTHRRGHVWATNVVADSTHVHRVNLQTHEHTNCTWEMIYKYKCDHCGAIKYELSVSPFDPRRSQYCH